MKIKEKKMNTMTETKVYQSKWGISSLRSRDIQKAQKTQSMVPRGSETSRRVEPLEQKRQTK